jgi:tryptophan-rich sensory protein
VTSLLPALAWCALVVVLAVLANVWNSHDPGWYAALRKPSFQPPDAVFGLMWPLSFALLLVVGIASVRTAAPGSAWTATGVLAVSVVLELGWAWLFYVPHRLAAAAACLAGAALVTWLLLGIVAGTDAWAGLLLLPYALWLSVATALSVAYARLD